MKKRTPNEVLVDAYSHLIDVSVTQDYEINKQKVKEYILEDKTFKRLFKNLSYNTYTFLTDPFSYDDEPTFKNEDFYLLYAIGIINEVMHIDPDYEQSIKSCSEKDKIVAYLKLQTGIKGLIDLYGVVDYDSLFEKVQYAFDSELFEIDVMKVDNHMFEEKTAPLLAAYCYEENGMYIRRELKGHLDEFYKCRECECDDCQYADYESDEILAFSSAFIPKDAELDFDLTQELYEFWLARKFSYMVTINREDLGYDVDKEDFNRILKFANNYPNWVYKGHCPSDMSSLKFWDNFDI